MGCRCISCEAVQLGDDGLHSETRPWLSSFMSRGILLSTTKPGKTSITYAASHVGTPYKVASSLDELQKLFGHLIMKTPSPLLTPRLMRLAPVHKVRLLYEEGYWVTLEQWAVGVSRAKLCSLAMMLDGLHSETRPWLSSLCAVAGR